MVHAGRFGINIFWHRGFERRVLEILLVEAESDWQIISRHRARIPKAEIRNS